MSPEQALRAYFHTKDENRPHLLAGVFSADARLEIRNRSDPISFPASTVGLEAIADVLVRRCNQTYENIYSFFLDRPGANDETFCFDWLVGMNEKVSRSVRVGWGRYDWTFRRAPALRVTQLVVKIEAMLVLDPAVTTTVMRWLMELGYPWTSAAAVTRTRPVSELKPVREYIGRRTGAQ